jgi:hypothetical protein
VIATDYELQGQVAAVNCRSKAAGGLSLPRHLPIASPARHLWYDELLISLQYDAWVIHVQLLRMPGCSACVLKLLLLLLLQRDVN